MLLILLEKMQQAVKEDDAAKIKITAHALKSTSGSFGATKLAKFCLELENLTRLSQTEGAEALLANMESEYEKVKEELILESKR